MDISLITHWHWWVLALAMVILEVFAPGAIFIWLGVAASIVGVILLVAPDLGWEYQFMTFAILSIVTMAAWKLYRRTRST